MKKRFIKFVAILIIFMTVGIASSCSVAQANVYNYWGTLPQDHIVKEISLTRLIWKVNAQDSDDENIFVFYGNPSSSACTNAIKIYNEQAVQYQISVLYWLDSDISDKKQTKLENKLGVADADDDDDSVIPAIFVFSNSVIAFDTTRADIRNQSTDPSYVEIAEVAFKTLYDDSGYYDFSVFD